MGSLQAELPYGRRLVPSRIDELAEQNPGKVFASIPKSFDLEDGYVDVTYDTFSRAINRAAAFLEDKFGKSSSFETLAYLGPFDIRYFILACAVCKVGYKLLLPSPRNSLEGQLKLFKSTDCKALLTSEGYNISRELVSETGILPIHVPSLASLLAEGDVAHYPFTKTYDEVKNDPFLVLHTSGSTGLPKPIILKHAWTSALDAFNLLEPVDGYELMWWKLKNRKTLVALPPFHSAGIIVGLLAPLFYDHVMVWSPSNRPLSAGLADEVLDASGADMIYAAPSILEDMVQSPASLQRLERLVAVGYGGAPLDPQAGDLLCQKTLVVNTTGSTEMGALPFYDKAPENWAYFHFHPDLEGIEFRPAGDGAYEQVFVRHPSTDKFHSAWWTFPDLQEYSMNDLYTPHPTEPNLWLYAGRADDVIVLSNGEKLNPSNMEATLRRHPSVKGALVVGQAKFVPAAIIELKDEIAESLKTPEEKAKFLEDELWPYAIEANQSAPAHAQLSLDMIIFSDDKKPFPRAGKGTIQRAATVKLYAEEIHEIYKRNEEGGSTTDLPMIHVDQGLATLEADIGALVETVSKLGNLMPDQDFFATGMDSLHVMTMVRLLKISLIGVSQSMINTRLIYSNPTLRKLATALQSIEFSSGGVVDKKNASREQQMQEVLNNFIAKLPQNVEMKERDDSVATEEQLVVLLTGSTGSLGSYLLHSLLQIPQVSKIYCVNRTTDAEARQAKANAEKDLSSKWDHRVEFLHAELSEPRLGLDEAVYSRLRDEVSVIIHNQWPVDFNLSLSSFTPHIAGVANLISLSARSRLSRSPPIFFTSSIGTLGNWNSTNPDKSPVPEIALKDPRVPLHQGYSESKWVAENVLSAARQKSGVSSAILRVGQIAGPVKIGLKGVWNKREWFPSLISSSKYLGVLPGELPGQEEVQWVPVDKIADIVGELVVTDCVGGEMEEAWTKYYHLCNPHERSWGNLVDVVTKHFAKASREVKVVRFDEWVARLERSAEDKDVDVDKNPGLKLLDFYRGMRDGGSGMKMDTEETVARSEKMKELKGVNSEWMRSWLEQWNF